MPLVLLDPRDATPLYAQLERALRNEIRRHGLAREPAAVVTLVLVDREDPAFKDALARCREAEARLAQVMTEGGWLQ